MRNRAFRLAALILGILGIPSLAWQVRSAWPLDQIEFYPFGGQADHRFRVWDRLSEP